MTLQSDINKDENKIKLYVNVLPTEHFDWDNIKIDVDRKVLYVRHLFEFHSSLDVKTHPKYWCFKTNRIFVNCCQEEVYSAVMSHMMQQLLQGVDHTILSFGQNFSGKSYTMSGFHNQYELRGMIPRFVSDLFQQLLQGVDHTILSFGQNFSGKSYTMSGFHNQYELRGMIPRFVSDLFQQLKAKMEDYAPKVYLSVVDIHKNSLYDLLTNPKSVCKVLKNVKKVEVSSEVHCLKLLFKAEARRTTIENKSYSSHSATNIVNLTVKLISINSHEPINRTFRVNFVDLAGMETIYRNPHTSFKDQRNQGDANFTKTMLELYGLRSTKTNEPHIMRMNQNMHVLTKYLNKALSPTSCISLICQIRPNFEDIKMTLSALKFGKTLQGIPVRNPEEHTEINYDMTLEKLTKEIKTLKDMLLILDLKEQKTPIKLSQDRIDFVKRTVNSFLLGEILENDLISIVDDTNLILNVMKSLHKQPILKTSVTLQTDLLLDPVLPKSSLLKQESIKTEETRRSSTKKVSLKNTPKGKADKTKEAGKAKVGNKVSLQSEETQVNLIEPNIVIPHLESREGLWAMFLISRPDIHQVLEKLNSSVAEKNKKLRKESTEYDRINESINNTQLALNHIVTYRHAECQEIYDTEGNIMVNENEAKLVKELRQLQRDMDQSKQRLIDTQFDWLEALERLGNEKEAIEIEFKQFCGENNFIPVKNPNITAEEEACLKENESVGTEATGMDLKKVYCDFQKKYLHKFTA